MGGGLEVVIGVEVGHASCVVRLSSLVCAHPLPLLSIHPRIPSGANGWVEEHIVSVQDSSQIMESKQQLQQQIIAKEHEVGLMRMIFCSNRCAVWGCPPPCLFCWFSSTHQPPSFPFPRPTPSFRLRNSTSSWRPRTTGTWSWQGARLPRISKKRCVYARARVCVVHVVGRCQRWTNDRTVQLNPTHLSACRDRAARQGIGDRLEAGATKVRA